MVDISIKKKYGNFKLNIQFSSESRRIGILGRSGSGKSLTLKSIAGIEKPDNGYINIDGNILFDKKSNRNIKTQKRHTGYMFQNYALFPAMTVEKNIMSVIKGSKKHREEMTLKLINQLGLKDVKNSLPSKLSGGQQQRCAMARIFASQPDTILLDEPFSALDIYIKDKMENELTDIIKDFKGTVILVSHNIDEIYRICDHTVVIDNGMVVKGTVRGKTVKYMLRQTYNDLLEEGKINSREFGYGDYRDNQPKVEYDEEEESDAVCERIRLSATRNKYEEMW